jgi:5,10-methylenetetrahydromethanopterin reductase
MSALAGELADEIKVGGSINPAMASLMLTRFQLGEKRAKRLGSVGLVMGAVTVVDEDRQQARRQAKLAVTSYLPVVANLDPTVNLEPELIQRIDVLVKQGRPNQAADLISDELLKLFAFAGGPEDVVHQTESLFDAGVRRIEFGTPHGLTSEKGLRLIGEQILPSLKY